MKLRTSHLGAVALGLLLVACSPVKNSASGGGDEGQGGSGAAGGAGGGTGGAPPTTSTDVGGFQPSSTSTMSGSGECITGADEDFDEDGFTVNQGDCNDCDPYANPAAVEAPTDPMDPEAMPADENCDGQTDEAIPTCDTGLVLNDLNPASAAQAIDICTTATFMDQNYGVINASWVRANGPGYQPSYNVGILGGFGPNVPPRNGSAMLGLSSGHARGLNDPNACGQLTCITSGAGTPPPGFPAVVPGCQGGTNINDDVALEVQMRAPSNATGYSFEFDFYSFEYPEWVCTTFNDQFIALVSPPPMGAQNGNISFDSMNNPVSVNIAFFQVCSGCAFGTAELQGTGFDVWDDAGATSWLVTTAPVDPGSLFSIRFAIWDTGDQAWDSTVLIDNFKWIATPGVPVEVGTVPVPE
jgi:hypothetical protein